MVIHTHMCKHACMQISVIFCILIVVFEGQQFTMAMGDRCCISQELVLLTPGMGSANLTSRRGWMTLASCGSCLFLLPLLLTTSTYQHRYYIPTEETNTRLLFSLSHFSTAYETEKRKDMGGT